MRDDRTPLPTTSPSLGGGVVGAGNKPALILVANSDTGESISNTILPGAVLTVDWGPVERVEPGHIYIVRTEDAGLTVKRVYPDYQRKVLVCVSDNRAFPPFTVGPDEGDVVGRVLRWEQGEI